MAQNGQTSKEYFSTMTIIHAGLLMAQVVFGVIAYFLKTNGMFQSNGDEVSGILMIIVPAVVVGGIAASYFISKQQIPGIKSGNDLKEKLAGYRRLLLIKLALLEMPTLFAIVCYLITGKFFCLALAGLGLAIFFINRPTLNGLAMDLELNPSERKTLEDPGAIVG